MFDRSGERALRLHGTIQYHAISVHCCFENFRLSFFSSILNKFSRIKLMNSKFLYLKNELLSHWVLVATFASILIFDWNYTTFKNFSYKFTIGESPVSSHKTFESMFLIGTNFSYPNCMLCLLCTNKPNWVFEWWPISCHSADRTNKMSNLDFFDTRIEVLILRSSIIFISLSNRKFQFALVSIRPSIDLQLDV